MSEALQIFLIALNGAGVLSFITFQVKIYMKVAVIETEIKHIKAFVGMKEV